MMEQYFRGSEWRRWDLHLHTPYTKKEDKYEGTGPDERWDNFYKTIDDYVGDGTDPIKAISVIAIADYLSIDNYKKVRDDKRLPPCVKLILPNVELRMSPISKKSPLNIHCIFSPTITDQIDERFFSQLKFTYNNRDYGASRSELIRFGRDYSRDSSLSEDKAYLSGLGQYVISPDTLSEIFSDNKDLKDNTIIVVSNNSGDGASGLVTHSSYFENNYSQLDATRQRIYQLSDMIFSGNQSDIEYFLGGRTDDEETVKHKCGSLMPCIHGCDAHTNKKVFEPDNKRYCWIKADPTFEGFKQILYEPKERVRISSTFPEIKQKYNVIDRVEIINDDNFSEEPIYFNDNLTCIIGGKSTGKSLLLHNMALAVDEQQVGGKVKKAPTNVKPITTLKVHWKDGFCNEGKPDESRKIIYIPQTYLNRLSDEKEETTEIDQIIQEIVLQDENASHQFKQLKENITSHKQKIAKTVIDLIQTLDKIKSLVAEKKDIGDEKGINSEIERLSAQLDQLSKEYNVTEDDIQMYQTASEKIRLLSRGISLGKQEKVIIEKIESVLQKCDFSQCGISLANNNFTNAIDRTKVNADVYWKTEREKLIIDIEDKLTRFGMELQGFREQALLLEPKIKGNEQISKTSTALLVEKEKLTKITELDSKLAEVSKSYDGQISILTNAFETFKNYHQEFAITVNSSFPKPTEDLEFHINCVFRTEQFSQKILDIFDKRTINRFSAIPLNSLAEQNLTPGNLRLLIESIISNSSETLQLTRGNSIDTALRDIFSNWYNEDYVVTMENDRIEEMSPGKKALVLLRLLISLAESKCPILIDQPEDDLDNRSIFEELIPFIKTKKVERQIIVVTHNANIVLGGDAELIQIANQSGNNTPNNKHRFEYRGGSIENNMTVDDELGNIQPGILNSKGIQTHVCEILEGGKRAFDLRRDKYRFLS